MGGVLYETNKIGEDQMDQVRRHGRKHVEGFRMGEQRTNAVPESMQHIFAWRSTCSVDEAQSSAHDGAPKQVTDGSANTAQPRMCLDHIASELAEVEDCVKKAEKMHEQTGHEGFHAFRTDDHETLSRSQPNSWRTRQSQPGTEGLAKTALNCHLSISLLPRNARLSRVTRECLLGSLKVAVQVI